MKGSEGERVLLVVAERRKSKIENEEQVEYGYVNKLRIYEIL